jgi:hypothetical protein
MTHTLVGTRAFSSLWFWVVLIALGPGTRALAAGDEWKPLAAGIQDNSFFIEEAYNQERGVVQHILAVPMFWEQGGDDRQREITPTFTQEWPLFSQTHQISYSVPFTFLEDDGNSTNGLGDILLNYRLQLFTETRTRPAVAPRVSLILPTGDEDRGLGNGSVGYQFNLPVSKIVADRWTVHLNLGCTFTPDVDGKDRTSFNVGASVIYAATRDLNFLVEVPVNWDDEVGIGREGSVIVSPGVRYAINLQGGMQIVLGLAAPIGLTTEAPDYGVFLYLSVEHPFLPGAGE